MQNIFYKGGLEDIIYSLYSIKIIMSMESPRKPRVCLCLEEGKVHALSLIREDDVGTVSKVGGEKGPEGSAPRIKLAML